MPRFLGILSFSISGLVGLIVSLVGSGRATNLAGFVAIGVGGVGIAGMNLAVAEWGGRGGGARALWISVRRGGCRHHQATRRPPSPYGRRIRWAAALMTGPARRRWLDDIDEALYDFDTGQHHALLHDFLTHAPVVILRGWTVDLPTRVPGGTHAPEHHDDH